MNSKWIKDLYVRPKTIKFLEETIGSGLFDINLSNFLFLFLDHPSQARATKAKINEIR